MKKALLILMTVLMSSTVAFTDEGETQGSCKAHAEKAAIAIYTLQARLVDLNEIKTNTRLLNVGAGQASAKWQVSFSGETTLDEEVYEWAEVFEIEVTNFGTKEEEACRVDKLENIPVG